ncbi:MAG: hypothetical protein JNL70_11225 [Saprospiraceae bacterium]|nr:hypothetical protein [Saprospiraceae bacterium]
MFSTEFIGHLHPLIVHVPIGILLFAFAMMLWQRFRHVDMANAIDFALLLGSISAGVACVAGWFLAQSGEYDAALVFKHQWTGFSTAVLGFLSYFIKNFRGILAVLTAVVLTTAGHYGGVLTHGEDYLFPKKKTPSVAKPLVVDSLQNIENSIVTHEADTIKADKNTVENLIQTVERKTFLYRDKIIPILENKCYSCHSATKKKGGLRLDSEDFIKEGGKSGAIFIAGNPENSNLFTALILPDDDDKHMPPKGKPQLTEQEIATIHHWIKKGVPFTETVEKVILGKTNAAIPSLSLSKSPKKDSLKTAIIESKNLKVPVLQNAEAQILNNRVEAIPPSVSAHLKQQNITLSPFWEGSNYVTANFVNVKNYSPKLIDDLQNIKNQLVRLRLTNQPVSDADISKISSFKNITHLNLEKTAITDVALHHLKNLPNLEQVNLYGTNITDAGLRELSKCAQLKVVYIWKTKTTAAGIAELKKALPYIQIEAGDMQLPKQDTIKK